MTLFRVEHKKNYSVINNFICTDRRLSWKAKGIWLYAFSRPDDWTFHLSDLINQSTDGRDSLTNGLKELENCGYLEREQPRDNGRFAKADWVFYEKPQELNKYVPQTDFPETTSTPSGNQPLLSTEGKLSIEREQTNTEDSFVRFSSKKEERKAKEKLLETYDLPDKKFEEFLSLSYEHLKNATEAFEQYKSFQSLKGEKVHNQQTTLIKAIACAWKPNITKEGRDKATNQQKESIKKLSKLNYIKALEFHMNESTLFNKDYKFSVCDNAIFLHYGNASFPVGLCEEGCIEILEYYIENNRPKG